MITISKTDHISSLFDLYSNVCTYLETALPDLQYTEVSNPLNDPNLSKHTEISYMNQIMW